MPTMHIRIASAGRDIACEAGENLMQLLLDHQIYVDNACSGKGLCGKCRVRVLQEPGEEPLPYTDEEMRLLSEKERSEGVHLCCMMDVQRDLTIELMQKEKKTEVLAGGYMPEFTHQPDTVKKAVKIEAPTLEKQTPFEEILKEAASAQSVDPLALPSGGRLPGIYTAVLHRGRITAVEEGDTEDQLYGAAIDIGTTTVVCSLVDLRSGKILADASQVNAQKHYGQDVLSRIT
ncbi:MAG: 2Fe-2S iron-sulfur cluster-binding protein, partial [Eubacterium sp.]